MNKRILRTIIIIFAVVVTTACLDDACTSVQSGLDDLKATKTAEAGLPETMLLEDTETSQPTLPPVEGELFAVRSLGGVGNGGQPPSFSVTGNCTITKILTYHWNSGEGVTPGTIGLEGGDGTSFGPFPASGEDGMGGVPNASWFVLVNLPVQAGVTYTVIDSDPSTWSQNDETNGIGITTVWGTCP